MKWKIWENKEMTEILDILSGGSWLCFYDKTYDHFYNYVFRGIS